MSTSPSGSPSSQPHSQLQNDANFEAMDTQNDHIPSPIPSLNEVHATNTQNDREPTPTLHSAPPALPITTPITTPTTTSHPEEVQFINATPSNQDSANNPLLATNTNDLDPVLDNYDCNSTNAITQPNLAQSDNENENENDSNPTQSPSQNPEITEPLNPNQPYPSYDWTDLEARFHAKMDECAAVEADIEREFKGLLAVRYFLLLSFLLISL